MAHKNKGAFVESDTSLLGHTTQAFSTLKKLKDQEKLIFKFAPTNGSNNKILEFRVYYTEKNFFYLRMLIASFTPWNKIAEGESTSERIILLVDKVPHLQIPQMIEDIIKEGIRVRLLGLELENLCKTNATYLIENDEDIKKIISEFVLSGRNSHDDVLHKIDGHFILKFFEEKLPVQIKNSTASAKIHQKGSSSYMIDRVTIENLELFRKWIVSCYNNFTSTLKEKAPE